jgi:hypothetical protein
MLVSWKLFVAAVRSSKLITTFTTPDDDLEAPATGVTAEGEVAGGRVSSKDENGTEISRTDRFRFLYYGSIFKQKKLSVSIGFITIFNHFLYSLIAKM